MPPLDALQSRIGYRFARPFLLIEALTHPSFVNEHPAAGAHNQRLEFLGDAVLQLIITDALYLLFPLEPEGSLSRRRSILTKGRCLTGLALELGLDRALRLAGGEDSDAGRQRPTNLEDAFEALVGAVYLDAGLDRTREWLLGIYGPLEPRLSAGSLIDNPKGRLQELVHPIHGAGTLRYETAHSGGPDHEREFSSRVLVGDQALGEGRGSSKKSAEEAAARSALERWPASAPERDRGPAN
jgi:ribonuclease-3